MSDEGKRREEQRRGELARQVIANEVYQEAVQAISHYYTQQWADSQPEEQKKREHAYRCLLALKEVHGLLNEVMRTGEMAQKTHYPEHSTDNP